MGRLLKGRGEVRRGAEKIVELNKSKNKKEIISEITSFCEG